MSIELHFRERKLSCRENYSLQLCISEVTTIGWVCSLFIDKSLCGVGILDFMSSSAAVMKEAWSMHAHAAACGNLSAAPSINPSLSSARQKNMSQVLLGSNHVLQKLLYTVTHQCLHSAKVSHLAILT